MDQLELLLARVGGWKSVAFAVVGLAVILVLRKLFATPPADPNRRSVVCACGWTGVVSRLKPRCPRCGKTETLRDA